MRRRCDRRAAGRATGIRRREHGLSRSHPGVLRRSRDRCWIAHLAPPLEIFLRERVCQCEIATIARPHGERVQRNGDALFVTQFTRDIAAFTDQNVGLKVVSLLHGEYACGKKSTSPRSRRSGCGWEFEEFAQPVSAFGEILEPFPETKQRGGEAQSPICIAG